MFIVLARLLDGMVSSVAQCVIQGKVRVPYFQNFHKVLAKITAKNQLTLPKSVTEPLGPVQYFDVQTRGGQIVLTPVRIQRGDALRAKLAELALSPKTLQAALSWAETQMGAAKTIETPKKAAGAKAVKPLSTLTPKKTAAKKTGARKTQASTGARTIETGQKPAAGLRAKPSSTRRASGAVAKPVRKTAAKPSSAPAKRSKPVAAATSRSRATRSSAGARRVA
ncbi:AbrB/MazE/SpoVT family DNA-binding domain-containing protein [Mitsuaria sp. WAJ17]|uniref:AbrB/MazE/SpoVT family DNA-binding domain-containing protein n=1 Tax=Mitsuaria sp. WAJ17 TaxID=2761452 RepID=UPI001C7F6CA4|nr:AbrB/MazE/SpoVT family DNA-binding domain-containing protein [Mitsuaria sp. WAJ17]